MYGGKMKKSLFRNLMISFLLIFLLIFAAVEIGNVILLARNRERINDLIGETIDKYIYYWEGQFQGINNSLLSIQPHEDGKDFSNLTESDETMNVELSKVEMKNLLNDISTLYHDQYYFFIAVPDRSIYIKSYSSDWTDLSEGGRSIQDTVLEYIASHFSEAGTSNVLENDQMWDTVRIGDAWYFIKIYSYQNGFVGALARAEDAVEDVSLNDDYMIAANLQTKDGSILCGDTPGGSVTKEFSINFGYTDTVLHCYYSDGLMPFNVLVVSVALLSLAVTLILAHIYLSRQSREVFKPLEKLRSAMIEFSGGNLDVRLPAVQKNDGINAEIGHLYTTFNSMADQIKDLKIQVYDEQIQKEKVLNDYLKLQIQPHFYSNILNLIYGFAEIHDDASIQKIAMATAAYFRYLLAEKSTFVKISSELDCVKNFAEIQKIRYGDILDFHYDIDKSAQDQLVIPLQIYTFVENAVKSNVTLRSRINIWIQAWKEKDRLIIRVMDDGVGIDPDTLSKLNSGTSLEENGRHIGIENIRARMKAAYGDSASLQFDSGKGGTSVTVNVIAAV